MNITTLTKAIEVLADSATTAQDILILSKVLERLKLGNVTAVTTYNDVLALTKNAGDLVFVDDEQKLYFKQHATSRWTPIFDISTQAWAWGNALSGQVGDNTTTPTSKSSPVSVVGGFTNWVQLSAGGSHTVGVRANGTAWAWGSGGFGRLGDGTITTRSSPVSVVGGFADWVQIDTGGYSSVGLRANGTAWAWGRGNQGQLGDGTAVDKSSPVSVVGGFTDWVQVSAGGSHCAGVRANGTAWAWGSGNSGVLGDNTTVSKSSPVSVIGGFTDWVQLSAGGANHTVGLRSNGTAWAWGNNGFNALGDSTAVYRSSPVSVVGGFTDWVQVSAGTNFSVGSRANGTAWAWGRGNSGQLGDGTAGFNRSSPVSVVGGFTDWVQVSAGANHTVGLRSNGTAWAWGASEYGQLGDNTTSFKPSPVSVVGGFTDWVQVSAGQSLTVALR